MFWHFLRNVLGYLGACLAAGGLFAIIGAVFWSAGYEGMESVVIGFVYGSLLLAFPTFILVVIVEVLKQRSFVFHITFLSMIQLILTAYFIFINGWFLGPISPAATAGALSNFLIVEPGSWGLMIAGAMCSGSVYWLISGHRAGMG